MQRIQNQYSTLKADEIQFLSQEELITIIPNFRSNEFKMIGGTYGPFEPLVPVQIPLWLALELKKNQRCSISPPSWLDVGNTGITYETNIKDYLKRVLSNERDDEKNLEDLPFHYLEIGNQLIQNASDDIRQSGKVRTLLEDIWAKRTSKLREGLLTISPSSAGVKLNNLSAMEINNIRPFLVQAMNNFRSIASSLEQLDQQQL